VVSGLEHELFLWYLLRTWGTQWFCFFTLQVSSACAYTTGGLGYMQGAIRPTHHPPITLPFFPWLPVSKVLAGKITPNSLIY
jgi:hypothetical protein